MPSLRTVLVAAESSSATSGALVAVIALTTRSASTLERRWSRVFPIALPAEAPFFVDPYPGACPPSRVTDLGSRTARISGATDRSTCAGSRSAEVRAIWNGRWRLRALLLPDGDWVAFFNRRTSSRGVASRGPRGPSPVTCATALRHGTWTDGRPLVLRQPIRRVARRPASGGAARRSRSGPGVAPGSTAPPGCPASSTSAKKGTTDRIESLSLDGGEPKTVLENASHPRHPRRIDLLFHARRQPHGGAIRRRAPRGRPWSGGSAPARRDGGRGRAVLSAATVSPSRNTAPSLTL